MDTNLSRFVIILSINGPICRSMTVTLSIASLAPLVPAPDSGSIAPAAGYTLSDHRSFDLLKFR